MIDEHHREYSSKPVQWAGLPVAVFDKQLSVQLIAHTLAQKKIKAPVNVLGPSPSLLLFLPSLPRESRRWLHSRQFRFVVSLNGLFVYAIMCAGPPPTLAAYS